MASTKSETTLNEAEKAVEARQNGPEPFDEQQYQILTDKCKFHEWFFFLTCIYFPIVEI